MTAAPQFRPTEQEQAFLHEARGLAQRSIGPAAQSAGALAITEDGERFPGVGIHLDNSGGLSVCAEQVAMSAARAGSRSPITFIALWVPPTALGHPCGPCRQIWLELAPSARLLLQRGGEAPVLLSAGTLMPDAFTSFEPQEGEGGRAPRDK